MTESVGARDEVVLTLPAQPEYVAVLRSLTATLAARCDLTVDEIDDLRIAVDEAGGLLLPHATEGQPLTARFLIAPGEIEIVAAVPAEADAEPDRGGFAWTVLEAVSDTVTVDRAGADLRIRLTKRREVIAR